MVQYLEKIIIFTFLLTVLIYTVQVDRNSPKNRQIPITKQEIPAPPPKVVPPKEASFFPESVPAPEDETIIEETFSEIP